MRISDIQRFCMHDGPGVRTTVFFKGCPMKCAWCHNPELKRAKRELLFYSTKCIGCGICASCKNGVHVFSGLHKIARELCTACGECAANCPSDALTVSGREMTADEIFAEVMKDAAFYGDTGGVTVSGGEPLMQPDGVKELLRICKNAGISTAIETSGCFDTEILRDIVPLCDLFLWDVKDTDSERHLKYTGKDNRLILENLYMADSLGAKTRLRCILVNEVNTNETHYEKVADIACELQGCEGVEFLPYHPYGTSKNNALGIDDCGCNEWIPSSQTIADAKEHMRKRDVNLF